MSTVPHNLGAQNSKALLRLEALKNKAQRAGLTPEEKLELVSLKDQLGQGGRVIAEPLHTPIIREHVQQRISGREAGERIVQTIAAVLQGLTEPRSVDSFWRAIKERYSREIYPDVYVAMAPMNEVEARSWESSQTMPFGQHIGELIRDVPITYLLWVESSDDSFKSDLKRYLASGLRSEERAHN